MVPAKRSGHTFPSIRDVVSSGEHSSCVSAQSLPCGHERCALELDQACSLRGAEEADAGKGRAATWRRASAGAGASEGGLLIHILVFVHGVLHSPACRMVKKHNLLGVINSPDFDTTSVEMIVFSLLRLLRQPFCSPQPSRSLVDSAEDTDVPFDDVPSVRSADE